MLLRRWPMRCRRSSLVCLFAALALVRCGGQEVVPTGGEPTGDASASEAAREAQPSSNSERCATDDAGQAVRCGNLMMRSLEAGASNAADACAARQGCTGSCLPGRANATMMVNGCAVERCCAPVDGGVDGDDTEDVVDVVTEDASGEHRDVADDAEGACLPSSCSDSTQCPVIATTCVDVVTAGGCMRKECCAGGFTCPQCPAGSVGVRIKDAKGCTSCGCAAP